MVNLIDRVDPGYQKAADPAAKGTEAAESAQAAAPEAAAQSTGESTAAQTAGQDTFVRSEGTDAAEDAGIIYKPNVALVEQLKAEHEQVMERFANMVRDMLGKQGRNIAVGQGYWKFMASSEVTVTSSIQGMSKDGGQSAWFSASHTVTKKLTVEIEGFWGVMESGDYEVDPEVQAAAQEAISGSGYRGVEQTAQRIVGFGRALTGGDPGKIDLLRDAFLKGMEAAQKAWGGALPEITDRTKARVLELFDLWAEEGQEALDPPAEDAGQVETPVEPGEQVETPAEPEEQVETPEEDCEGRYYDRDGHWRRDDRDDRGDGRWHRDGRRRDG